MWRAQLDAVRKATATRTPEQAKAVLFWAGNDGTFSPAAIWLEMARDMISRDRMDVLPTAGGTAVTSIAIADAFICCWDTKYTYWVARPIQADGKLDVQFPTPPFPSYMSAHATLSGAASTVLGHLFPGDADDLDRRTREAKKLSVVVGVPFPYRQRCWIGSGDGRSAAS
jgi:hypothetical protein